MSRRDVALLMRARRPRTRVVTVIVGAVVTLAGPLPGQTLQQGHAWLNLFGDYAMGARTSLYVEVSARRADFAREWQQQVLALGVTRRVSSRYRATATVLTQRSFAHNEVAGTPPVNEIRPWFQVAGQRPVGDSTRGWQWADRSRLEVRFQQRDASFDIDGDWRNSWRLRRQDRLTKALGGGWSVNGSQEWFLGAIPLSGGPLFEQTRTQVYLGKRLTRRVRIEGGYMLQWLERRNSVRELNHTMVLTLRT